MTTSSVCHSTGAVASCCCSSTRPQTGHRTETMPGSQFSGGRPRLRLAIEDTNDVLSRREAMRRTTPAHRDCRRSPTRLRNSGGALRARNDLMAPEMSRSDQSDRSGAGDEPSLPGVLPCLHESETLATCIRKALGSIEELRIAGEVVVADNGS